MARLTKEDRRRRADKRRQKLIEAGNFSPKGAPPPVSAQIIEEINTEYQAVLDMIEEGYEHAIRCGELLRAAKDICRKRKEIWKGWLALHCPEISERIRSALKLLNEKEEGDDDGDEGDETETGTEGEQSTTSTATGSETFTVTPTPGPSITAQSLVDQGTPPPPLPDGIQLSAILPTPNLINYSKC